MSALEELLVEQMRDLLHAEGQLVKAFPKMAKAAHNPKLKESIQNHLEETKNQVERLKEAFELLGSKARAKPCAAMQGLVQEGLETIEEGKEKEETIADIALIASAQKIEHYEISGYGTLRSIADQLGNKKLSKLLAQTLAEEEKADQRLTSVTGPIIEEANQEPVEEEELEEV